MGDSSLASEIHTSRLGCRDPTRGRGLSGSDRTGANCQDPAASMRVPGRFCACATPPSSLWPPGATAHRPPPLPATRCLSLLYRRNSAEPTFAVTLVGPPVSKVKQ